MDARQFSKMASAFSVGMMKLTFGKFCSAIIGSAVSPKNLARSRRQLRIHSLENILNRDGFHNTEQFLTRAFDVRAIVAIEIKMTSSHGGIVHEGEFVSIRHVRGVE